MQKIPLFVIPCPFIISVFLASQLAVRFYINGKTQEPLYLAAHWQNYYC